MRTRADQIAACRRLTGSVREAGPGCSRARTTEQPWDHRVRPGRHPDERDTRERILDVALDLFIEQGYDKTTLRQIAEPLGFTQAAIYYHFAAKEDILVALHLRLHELARPVLEQLVAEAGPSGWAAVLRGLVDTMLANRKLFILHQRNQTALSGLHIKGHDGDHEDMEQQFRQILGNPVIPVSPPATGSG